MYGGKKAGKSYKEHNDKLKLAEKNGDLSLAYIPLADTVEEIDELIQEHAKKMAYMCIAETILFGICWSLFFIFSGDGIYGSKSNVTSQVKLKYIFSFIVLFIFFSLCFGENMCPQKPHSPFTNSKFRNGILGVIIFLLLIPPAQIGGYFFNSNTFVEHLIVVLVLFFSSAINGALVVSLGLKSLIIQTGMSKEYQLYGSKGHRQDVVENLKLKKIEESNRQDEDCGS